MWNFLEVRVLCLREHANESRNTLEGYRYTYVRPWRSRSRSVSDRRRVACLVSDKAGFVRIAAPL